MATIRSGGMSMNRLTERDWKSKCEGYPWNMHPVKDIDDLKYYKKLAAYEDAEEQGLLLRLPCKVGGTVYHIVERIILEVENVNLFFLLLSVAEGRFGKTIFLAKEEAETMLKK